MPEPATWIAQLREAVTRVSTSVSEFINGIDLRPAGEFLMRVGRAIYSLLPPNLGAVPQSRWAEMTCLAREEQLCLAWVPNAATVTRLLDAHDGVEREDVLITEASSILNDCLGTVTALEDDVRQKLVVMERLVASNPELTYPMRTALRFHPDVLVLLRESITVAQTGQYAAAQALATCVTDSVLTQDLAAGWSGIQTYAKKYLNTEQQDAFRFTVIDVMEAIKSVYARSTTWEAQVRVTGSATRYCRHATTHAATSTAYTPATALKAIILATSVLAASNHVLALFALNKGAHPKALPRPATPQAVSPTS